MQASSRGDGAEWARTVREHADGILASLEEANRVVDELLRFGQDRALNLYPQSLPALLDECASDCRTRATERGVALEVIVGADTAVVLDKHKVKQAIGNLLDNAIDASPPGAAVEVRHACDGAVVRIEVRDHGAGIADDVRPRLFTPFCRTKPHGIGRGLVLARELVEAHGGRIDWRPATPGTIFIVTLPLDPAPIAPEP